MSINIMSIAEVNKVDFGVTNPAIKSALQSILTMQVKAESDTHKTCEHCFNVRENATGGKINGTPWAKFIELKFGKRLTAASAMKYATVYGVYIGVDREKAPHADLFDKLTVGKLIILSPLDGKKHKDAGRSIDGFLAWLGRWKNGFVAEPYLKWVQDNKTVLDIAAKLPENEKNALIATLPEPPAEPLPDNAELSEFIAMGVLSAIAITDSVLKEKVQEYIAENLNTPEQKAAAEKKSKSEAAEPEKLRKKAEDALTEYLATLDRKPLDLVKAVESLQALAPKKDGEKK